MRDRVAYRIPSTQITLIYPQLKSCLQDPLNSKVAYRIPSTQKECQHWMLSLSGCVLLSLRLHGPPRTGRIASIAPAARFEAFDWLDHWQPIAWARDLPLDQPTKITLFDVDYAVTRRSGGEPLALLDRCPHRGAALSEGRVTSQGWMQCAYHGWAFDAGGACQSVPQQERAPTSALPCVTSRACVEHHGMLWLH